MMEKAASPLRNRSTRKQHIMSGLLNLSSIKGEAIYFVSPHTSARPRTYVLVTGGGSNGEPNCLGKKINKQHDELIHRRTLMAGVSGPERFPEAAQRICTFTQACENAGVQRRPRQIRPITEAKASRGSSLSWFPLASL